MKRLVSLDAECRKRHLLLEQKYGLSQIVTVTSSLPDEVVQESIKHYQGIIRGNQWYFPTLVEDDLGYFLDRWGKVHENYFIVASEVFDRLVEGKSFSYLADVNLMIKVIQSETMRGWVGKRSPSGLDAMLARRVTALEKILSSYLSEEDIDEVLAVFGLESEDERFQTAETEIVRLFGEYYATHGGEKMSSEALAVASESSEAEILRGFCKYSVDEFNKKLVRLGPVLGRIQGMDLAQNRQHAEQLLDLSSHKARDEVLRLLSEVRILNQLNLNLEVKYSFKGWAGLMHIAVCAACSDASSIPTDVYAIRMHLIESTKGENR